MKNVNKKISFIIPVHNEEEYLEKQLIKIINHLKKFSNLIYELLIINNGSNDKTLNIAKKFIKEKKIKLINLKYPSYGNAIKHGILKSSFDILVQFDIDFFDFNFLKKGLRLIEKYPIIVGSKILKKSKDLRPRFRILITKVFSFLTKKIFLYQGTDTHGIKIFRKKDIIGLINKVKSKNHLFDTELLIRAQFQNLKIKELPVNIKEIRPTRFPYHTRLISFFREFIILVYFFYKEILPFKNLFNKNSNFNFIIDDYGCQYKIDKKIITLLPSKKIAKISILPNYITKKSIDLLKKIKDKNIKLACHINLTEGKSITSQSNFDNLPFFILKLFFNLYRLENLKKEIESQICFLINQGLKIDEINSHQHIHALTPINEICLNLAKKYKIKKIRKYKNLKAITFKAKIKLFILKTLALISYLTKNKKIKMPSCWNIKNKNYLTFLSLEDKSFFDKLFTKERKKLKIDIVIHPFFSYDNDKRYFKLLKNNYEN